MKLEEALFSNAVHYILPPVLPCRAPRTADFDRFQKLPGDRSPLVFSAVL